MAEFHDKDRIIRSLRMTEIQISKGNLDEASVMLFDTMELLKQYKAKYKAKWLKNDNQQP
jgi:hypothetical protein